MGFDAYNYWDFYDVPVPARKDSEGANGPRNRSIDMGDVIAVLFYSGALNNGPPNGNGVDYDSLKDGDWTGDTVVNSADEVGRRYDRTPGAPPGPPDGAISMSDVVAALGQVGRDCSGSYGASGQSSAGGPLQGASPAEGGALSSAPNAMAVDAVPGGGIDTWRYMVGTNPFEMDIVVTAAGSPYAGYNALLAYDDQVLEFVPTVDLDGDTTLESWTYTSLGGMSLDATVSMSDADGDTVPDRAVGGSARASGTTPATGAVITGRFRCIGNGTSAVHLVTTSESATSSTTLGVGGATIDTSLADANVWCWVGQ